MRIYLSFLFLLCFSTLCRAQIQHNYTQELYDLLMNGKNFEAIAFKSKHKDQILQDFNLVYNMHMSLAFNKPDSTIVYFEEFLSNPDKVNHIGPIVGVYFVRLCETYENKQQFEKSISVVDRHLKYLKENPYSLNPELIKKDIAEAEKKRIILQEKRANEPIRKIKWDNKDGKIKLKNNTHIRFDAQYNGHTIETFFDTGVSQFCIMEKALADEIGVKYRLNQDSIRLVNGKPTRSIDGYIDSIELKGVKLYNIPVAVLLDKFVSNLPANLNADFRQNIENELLKSRQVIFGLPTMKLIGRFEFDWKLNTLVIPQKKEQKAVRSDRTPNVMFIVNAAYINMKINEVDFTGFLDVGTDDYLFLTYPYFFKSKFDYVKNDAQKQPYTRTGFSGVQQNVERQRVENTQIYFDGKKIDTNKPLREVYAVANLDNFDGEVGVGFFKNNFSKTIFDFNTMIIECEE